MDQAVNLLPREASPDGDGAAGSQLVPGASGRTRARRRLDPEPSPGRPAVSVRQSAGSPAGPDRRGCAGPPAPTAAGRADPPGGQGGAGGGGGRGGPPPPPPPQPLLPPLVCHAPPGGWLRHSNRPGVARTQGREDDDDLHPCAESGWKGGEEPDGRTVNRADPLGCWAERAARIIPP